uniref:DNA 3'-5' helicase n=1 Tax=Phlebotomus papatasi TaxID=29031 RepID=A0A1B0DF19_PHLPP
MMTALRMFKLLDNASSNTSQNNKETEVTENEQEEDMSETTPLQDENDKIEEKVVPALSEILEKISKPIRQEEKEDKPEMPQKRPLEDDPVEAKPEKRHKYDLPIEISPQTQEYLDQVEKVERKVVVAPKEEKPPRDEKHVKAQKSKLAELVVGYLMPYYREKRFDSKEIFKKLAKHLSHKFYDTRAGECIVANLHFKEPISKFTTPCFRENLFYDVIYKNSINNDFQHLKEFIMQCREPGVGGVPCGIIYCRTRDQVERVAKNLTNCGLVTFPYHAGLKPAERITAQEEWMSGKYPVICATISFGMGVDKSAVRFVVHWDIPQSIAGYYQESGRAGRDGKKSYCRLYYCRSETNSVEFLLKQDIAKSRTDESADKAKQNLKNFEKMVKYCETVECRHKFFADYFGDETPVCINRCDVCKNPKQSASALEKFHSLSSTGRIGGKLSYDYDDYCEDLYEGGKRAQKQAESEYSDSDSSSSREQRAKKERMSLIQKEFAARKQAAEQRLEREFASARISRVKHALNTETKIIGLTISLRESYLSMIADLLKKNYDAGEKDDTIPDTLIYRDFEDIGVELEYKIFTVNKVISLYRRSAAKLMAEIKGSTAKNLCYESFVNYQPKKKEPREEPKDVTKEKSKTSVEKRKPHKHLKKDYMKQTSLKSFFSFTTSREAVAVRATQGIFGNLLRKSPSLR